MIWIALVWAAVFIGCLIVFLKSPYSDSSSDTHHENNLPSTKFAGSTQPGKNELSINVQPTKREFIHIDIDPPFHDHVASVAKEPDKQQTIESHYQQIDEAINKEKTLRETTSADISKHKEQKTRYLNKARTIWIVAWIIAVTILTPLIRYIFSCETWLLPLIDSLIIASPIAIYAICSLTAEITSEIANYGKEKELANERNIVKMYTELLNNVDVYQFLGIPSNIVFDKNDLPNTFETDFTLPRPYGNYTRFVAPHSGSRYHVKRGCSGAYHPVHIYDLSLNEYRFNWRYLSACQVCVGYKDSVEVPKWFIYYRKVREITNEYGIKSNYRK